MFNVKINYFDWAIFNSKTLNYQRVSHHHLYMGHCLAIVILTGRSIWISKNQINKSRLTKLR